MKSNNSTVSTGGASFFHKVDKISPRLRSYGNEHSSYSRYHRYYRILGFITLILSISELVIAVMLHYIIQAAGIGSWWASLAPLLTSIFSLNVNSGSRLAAMLLNGVLGVLTTMIGFGVEI